MSQLSSLVGHLPGMGTVVETFESAVPWGIYPRYYTGAYIASTATDPTNVPTTTLRMGLVLGQTIATGQWTNYSPTASDGSEVAKGVLVIDLRMLDAISGLTLPRFYAIYVSGGVQARNLIGLDNMARAQMSKNFIFDDDLAGRADFPWLRFQTKTANYTIVASDNLSHFDNLGAVGEVDFTLPAIANGYSFGFTCMVGQVMKVISFEGANLMTFNNAGATSVAFQTGGNEIGGGLHIYSNPAATKWIVEPTGANTLTVA